MHTYVTWLRWLPIKIGRRYIKGGSYHSANAIDTFVLNVNWRWHHISQKLPHSAVDALSGSIQHGGAIVCRGTRIYLNIVFAPVSPTTAFQEMQGIENVWPVARVISHSVQNIGQVNCYRPSAETFTFRLRRCLHSSHEVHQVSTLQNSVSFHPVLATNLLSLRSIVALLL
jgi:hypothetical protein